MFTLTRWGLLKDQRFLLTMLGTSIAFTAMMNFFMFLPVHAKAHGIALDKVATLVSINNSLSLATIMLYSWLGGQPGKSRNHTLWCQLEDTVLLMGTLLLFNPVLFPKYEA